MTGRCARAQESTAEMAGTRKTASRVESAIARLSAILRVDAFNEKFRNFQAKNYYFFFFHHLIIYIISQVFFTYSEKTSLLYRHYKLIDNGEDTNRGTVTHPQKKR